jgi:site-specific DNA-cytosine methylase
MAANAGLPVAPSLLPTPAVAHLRNHDEPVEDYLQRRQDFIDGKTKGMSGASLGVAVRLNWGKYEPAIKRWEQIVGRSAPDATQPDGKNGTHRLTSKFTEWLMGLPDGWITDCGLSRKDELKACGNGVVPQQAELALRILLTGTPLEKEIKNDYTYRQFRFTCRHRTMERCSLSNERP